MLVSSKVCSCGTGLVEDSVVQPSQSSWFIYLSFNNKMQAVVPLWCTKKCIFGGGELRNLTTGGQKLLCTLNVRQWILYTLPDGSRVNRLWLGWVLSFSIWWAPCRDFREICRQVPVMFWAGLITRGRAVLSLAGHELCQFAMSPVRMLFYCTPVKADKNWAQGCEPLKFLS